MGPNRNEWQKRCTFNGFCKKVLKNEAIDAIRENRTRSKREVTFSDLAPQEENQLYIPAWDLGTIWAPFTKKHHKNRE